MSKNSTMLLVAVVLAPVCGSKAAKRDVVSQRSASQGDEQSRRLSLEDLGFAPQRLSAETSSALQMRVTVRANHLVTAARLRLSFAQSAAAGAGLGAVDVMLNGEVIAHARADEGAEIDQAIDPALFADDNLLVLQQAEAKPCELLPSGSWRQLRSGELNLRVRSLPLPDDLATLPLPFIDPRVPQEEPIAVVLLTERSIMAARAAGMVAGFFGMRAGRSLRFDVSAGELPSRSAVVLVTADQAALALGSIEPDEPSVWLQDHPDIDGGGHKLLVIAGRDQRQLFLAAQSFIARGANLSGKFARFDAWPRVSPVEPYDAPRWVEPERALRFAASRDGNTGARQLSGSRIEIPFRIAPDLFVWPDSQVELELHYRVFLPPSPVRSSTKPPPTVTVELNGRFVGNLPAESPLSKGPMERRVARLTVHPSLLSGFNRMVLSVTGVEDERRCPTASAQQPQVALETSSVIHMERARHFATLPDLNTFLYDGFPFTRMADLSQTAIILPSKPDFAEMELLLSTLSQLCAITGGVPIAARFLPEERVELGADKDLLVVARAEHSPLLARWASRLPFRYQGGRLQARRPSLLATGLALSSGLRAVREPARAAGVLSQLRETLVVAGIESPLEAGRSAVLLIAPPDRRHATLADAFGHADAAVPRGDLLVAAADERAMFRLGRSYTRGDAGIWTRLRWFLSLHWLLLLPAMLTAVTILALSSRGYLLRCQQRRIGERGRGSK